MMSEHPSIHAVARYLRGDLPADEILAIDDHLAACAACRERGATASAAVHALRDAIATDRVEHPDYDALEGYVDNTLDRIHREMVDSHLATCESCAEDVGDLRRARAELSTRDRFGVAPAEAPRSWRMWGRALAGASGLAAAAAVAWFLLPPREPGPVADRAAEASAATRVELRDAGRQLRLTADGRIDGLPDSLLAADRSAVEAAVASGRLALAPAVSALRGSAGALMGAEQRRATLAPVAPVGTVVEPERPRFRWTALPEATGYRVAVYDPNFEEVAGSPELNGTEWTPERALPRDVALTWQITATTSRGSIQAPVPPAPEARFRVADAQTVARLDEARRTAAGSHLVLAVVYSQAGLVEAAADEIRALRADNPDSPLAASLLDSLRAR